MVGTYNTYMKTLICLFIVLFSSMSLAHRDSDIDNLKECMWNQAALEGETLNVVCNDLYHLYEPKKSIKSKKGKSFKLSAFNFFALGAGDSRFKNYKLTANILKNYDLVAVSEVQPSTSEEFDSNLNLSKSPSLNFKKYYHKPGYLKLLEELRRSNSSWSLIISPVGQSGTEELLGFYFRKDRVSLSNSSYCKSYSRNLKSERTLAFAGGYGGPRFQRAAELPHLNKSYGCLMNIENDENDIFRVPFSARFKVGSGFDFQFLSYHARFNAPIVLGRGACGFECLERVNSFLNTRFHKKGAFLGTLDSKSLNFLKSHIDYLGLKKDPSAALLENYGPVIKFKYSKPRVYSHLLNVKDRLNAELPKLVKAVWQKSYKEKVSAKDRDKMLKFLTSLFKSSKEHGAFDDFVSSKGEVYESFLDDVLNQGVFAHVKKRREIWTDPKKIARFYEVSLILDEMEQISKLEKDKDVLLGGDFNLEDSKDPYFWNFFNKNNDYSTIAIGSPTSISKKSGLLNAYDHFMYDGQGSLEECRPVEASVLDFVNDRARHWKGFEEYFVKTEAQVKKLGQREFKKLSKIEFIDKKGEPVAADKIIIKTRSAKSCWTGQVETDVSQAKAWQTQFECRTLNQFRDGQFPFRIYTDLISDHLPVGMKCSKLSDLD